MQHNGGCSSKIDFFINLYRIHSLNTLNSELCRINVYLGNLYLALVQSYIFLFFVLIYMQGDENFNDKMYEKSTLLENLERKKNIELFL